MNNLKITYNSSPRRRKEEEKERYVQLYFFSPLLPNYINHDKLKK